jgi:cytochrome o ubiquinol oxidase subunit 1
MFGKLSWSAIPFDQPIPLVTSLVVVLALLGVAIWVWRNGWWPYLWNEYMTSTDHKRIGIMYIVLALVMLVRGFADAIMMRAQQSLAIGASQGYLPPEHYNQLFSAHGTIMIFFMAMPIIIGMMNFVVPLQLGVRDVAFPTMNNVSFPAPAGSLSPHSAKGYFRLVWGSIIISSRCKYPVSGPS